MNLFHSSPRWAALLLVALAAAGCANPGPPRPPSLHLPEPVRDLTAARSGDTVELRFTAPTRSTDKLSLHGALTATLCRELDHATCIAVPSLTAKPLPATSPNGTPPPITWQDHLPSELASGAPRLLGYRVEIFNALNHSAGKSEATFIAAGQTPANVDGLHTQGSREGIVISWNAIPHANEDVLLRREDLAPDAKSRAKAKSEHRNSPLNHQASMTKTGDESIVWLDSHADAASHTLDATALPDVPYRYIAVRQKTIQLGGRTFELRSAESAALVFTLREIYPPIAPTGVVAAGFTAQTGSSFAVDLVWQPVDDAKLAGYNVYRQVIDVQGFPAGERVKLNDVAVALPGFHDATATDAVRYRYFVTAVDPHGNESEAATAVLEPTQVQ